MTVIGIVCEYNPFHNGHLYQLRESRRLLGENAAVVCVMSGDFVQRGEAAVYSKFARAEAACRCGADLVIELPLPWSVASAENFARGAVSLLGHLGVTHLSFGSETGDLTSLSQLAKTLLDPSVIVDIKNIMLINPSLSFAAARQQAVENRLGAVSELLSRPNDILAVEYLKAIQSFGLPISPLAIPRLGAGHDEETNDTGPKSASELRAMLTQGNDISEHIPAPAAEVYHREHEKKRELNSPLLMETAMLSRLRLFEEEYFLTLPDCADGLGSRLYHAVREESSLEAVFMAAKSKRHALSRIRRAALCACLGITADMLDSLPPYARVLAANSRGRNLLRELSKSASLPLLTKSAAVRDMSDDCQAVFSRGSAAHDFYVLGFTSPEERACGQDWRTGPSIIDE